jgi:hypothetical protein
MTTTTTKVGDLMHRAVRQLTTAAALVAASGLLALGTGVLDSSAQPVPTAAEVPLLPQGQPHPPVGMTLPQPPPCSPGVVACVQLSTSLAWLHPAGQPVLGPVPIGYGVGAHATPTGDFQVSWKAEHYTSHEYDEPMPDAVFFAPGGIAFHAGSLDTSSHGCVHLAPATAAAFFAALKPGDRVEVLP